jgi:hypothetical protein
MQIKHHESEVSDVVDVLALCIGDVRNKSLLIDPHVREQLNPEGEKGAPCLR